MSIQLYSRMSSFANMFSLLNSDDEDLHATAATDYDYDSNITSASTTPTSSILMNTLSDDAAFDASDLLTVPDEVKALQDALNRGVSWYDVMYPNNEEIKEIIRHEQHFESSTNTNWTTVQKKKKSAPSTPPSSKKNSKHTRRH